MPMRPKLLITRRLGESILEDARRRFNVTVWPRDEPIGSALEAAADGQDALLVMTTDVLDEKRLAKLQRGGAKAIATFSVGHERIDVPAASRLGIPIFNTPDVLSDTVADLALFLILAASRGTTSAEHVLRSGNWGPWSPTAMLGRQLRGLRLGIYGMGGIGRAIAQRARAFGLAVHYHNRSRLDLAVEQEAVFHPTLDALMQISDILCICAPASATTRGSIDARRLALMPSGGTVVNIARGDLVDEDALIQALSDGRVASAGLDVFRNEPNIDTRFLHLANATLLPHIGGATVEARNMMGDMALTALQRFLCTGVMASNCVNADAFGMSSQHWMNEVGSIANSRPES
jgi:lactate dehydrogenase-like 2-hydroxyacid dehydrogenase